MMPRSLRAVTALVATFALVGCAGDRDAGPAEVAGGDPEPGGTAVIAVLSDFQAFNPVTNTHLTTDDVIKHMLFTPLVQYDEELNPQPWLAERWELTDTSVTFRLRRDVRWHDGQPVTAGDVKFTFDLAKDPEAASLLGSAYLNLVRSATVVDSFTVHFTFESPHAQALDGFWWPPLPAHLLEGVAAAGLAQHAFNRQPVGSGPFRFADWRPNQSLTLAANPDHAPSLGGPPHLERVVFRVVPEATTMVTELINGTADMIGYTLLPDQAAQIRDQRGVELRHYPSREFTFFAWNHTRPLFAEPRVRRAMTMAIDRQQIIDGLLQRFAVPSTGMIPPWSPMHPDLEALPHDPAAARRLLEEVGWRDSDGDGLLDRDGRPFRFVLTINSANRLHADIAQVMQQQLRQVGVDVQIRPQEFQSLLQQYKAREYDAVLANWSLDTFKVDPSPLFSCAQAQIAGSANRTGYCNPGGDALMAQGLRTTDEGEGRRIWSEYSRILQEDQPLTFLYWIEDMAGLGPRMRNVQTDVRSKIVNIREWWIPANRRR
jgi:peptide/nickel transport system substrate-binding protein